MRREITKQVDDIDSIKYGLKWAEEMLRKALLRGPAVIRLSRPTRSKAQNDKIWPMLGDISKQVDWHGQKLADYEWKDVFTAALKRQKVVPGIDGGFVVIGAHTSKMKVKEVSDLIELMYAFGAERDVIWGDESKKIINLQKGKDYEVEETS